MPDYSPVFYVGTIQKSALDAANWLKTTIETITTGSALAYVNILQVGPGKYYEPVLLTT